MNVVLSLPLLVHVGEDDFDLLLKVVESFTTFIQYLNRVRIVEPPVKENVPTAAVSVLATCGITS